MCELIEKYMILMKENKNTRVEDYIIDVKKLIEKYLPPEIAEERKNQREAKKEHEKRRREYELR
jgi:hypothetical protein